MRSSRQRLYARRDALRIGLSGLVLAARPVAAQGTLRPVNIVNTASNTTFALQELLKQQGYLREFGLDATTLNVGDGVKLLGALLSGSSDICLLSGFGQIFPAIDKGGRFKLIAGGGILPAHAVYSRNDAVKTLKDLEGRYVGCGAPGALLHQFMVAALRKHEVDLKKVQFVNIGSSADVFRAVAAGKVDAGPSMIDASAEMQKYSVHVVAELWKEIPEFSWQGSYTTDAAIEKKRDELVRTLAAYAKLYRFISGPDSREAFMRAYMTAIKQADPAQAEIQWRFAQENKGAYSVDLVMSEERIRYMQQLNVDTGVQKTILPFDRVADMSLARDALKLLG
jgi:ABC-type nitrate/sulfonate/bicarbonate transport system substrate-binding protein